jgi:hypothetical protein
MVVVFATHPLTVDAWRLVAIRTSSWLHYIGPTVFEGVESTETTGKPTAGAA